MGCKRCGKDATGDREFCDDCLATVHDVLSVLRCRDFAKPLLQELLHEHRTHQQSVMATMAYVINGYAESDGYDMRNQAAKLWAGQVADLPDKVFPFI